MTLAWFLLVRRLRRLPARRAALLANLTKCGLGVYMIHYFVVGLGYRLVDMLAVNVQINDDETREASSGLNNKKQGIWDSDSWLQ